MTDQDRAPLIRLQVDQEVFIDTVQSGDVIEDATVATEVTSFDRIGDAYVLEGALVFAGYLKRGTDVIPNLNTAANEYDLFSGEAEVQHVHHRMPFVLRVPARSQPKGIVNVASRISSWSLDVMSTGWVRVLAELNVVGLVGKDGFHFQCGAQEEGDVFFDQFGHLTPAKATQDEAVFEPVSVSRSAVDSTAEDQPSVNASADGTSDENAFEDEFVSQFRAEPDSGGAASVVEAVSALRGGNSDEPTAPESDDSVREQLKEFDRAFSGSGETEQVEAFARSGESGSGEAENYKEDVAPPAATEWDVSPEKPHSIAEFEFVHQVPNADAQADFTDTVAGSKGAFVPSRSFSSEGFHPANAFVPDEPTMGAVDAYQRSQELKEFDSTEAPSRQSAADTNTGSDHGLTDAENAGPEVGFAGRGEGLANQTQLWSFVDFHQPERLHTLRYVVVMEEETIDAVAERVGCMKSDLVRVNRLSEEYVRSGQTLLIPSRPSFLRAQ